MRKLMVLCLTLGVCGALAAVAAAATISPPATASDHQVCPARQHPMRAGLCAPNTDEPAIRQASAAPMAVLSSPTDRKAAPPRPPSP